MEKKPIVSVTYENERISIKNSLQVAQARNMSIGIGCVTFEI